ncbi:MAG: phosphoglycerate kinase [Deltaproteobacteria bacterium]|jgi:phosphoglycerate kinase|nr:phosphoglycerate kinase [Deltaproteobacteria bacterium]
MRFGIKTIDELKVEGRTVLLRVDINQPLDLHKGGLKDITRIRATVPTIRELSNRGAKTVLLGHQGSMADYQNFGSLKPHSMVLNEFLGGQVKFVEDICGPTAITAIKSIEPGGIVLLENIRFLAEENGSSEFNTKLGPAGTLLVRKLAPLADCYISDAFAAAHRNQPSLCGFPTLLPAGMGRLFEKEYSVLTQMRSSQARPYLFVLGGKKIVDSVLAIKQLLKSGSTDCILTGGLVAQFLSWAIGDLPAMTKLFRQPGCGPLVELARKLLNEQSARLVRPCDYAFIDNGRRVEAAPGQIPPAAEVTDIGGQTANQYAQAIAQAKTIFVNGPMGRFQEPQSKLGTRLIWEALSRSQAFTVMGGGESIAAALKFGSHDRLDYVSTGGGALIRFLTGEQLPAVLALRKGSLLRTKNTAATKVNFGAQASSKYDKVAF